MKLILFLSALLLSIVAFLSSCQTGQTDDFSSPTAKALDVKFGSGFANETLHDITIAANGNIYVSSKTRIYKVDAGGVAEVLAGGANSAVVDGQGASASFKTIGLLSLDNSGNIYALDSLALRKISSSGTVTTVQIDADKSRFPDLGIPGKPFNRGLVEKDGVLYLAYFNYIVKINAGVLTHYAGNFTESGFADGNASTAMFRGTKTIILDAPEENFIVADGSSLRKVSLADTIVTTITGGPAFGKEDGTFAEATFQQINDVVVDKSGNYYLSTSNTIRKVSVTGQVTTIAGPIKSDGGAFTAGGLALDPEEKFLYVVDMEQPASIVKIDLSKI